MIQCKGLICKREENMEKLIDFFNNRIFFAVLTAWLVTQILKFLINLTVERKAKFERLIGDGGMPSGHSATVMTLAILIGWSYGYASPAFAIAALLAIIVMHDATGVRRETGKQAVLIKQFADILNDFTAFVGEKDADIRTEKLKVLVGHTPLQVFFGALVGVVVSVVYILIMNPVYAAYAL